MYLSTPAITLGILFALVCMFVLRIQDRNTRKHHLPPGPKGLPFLGNLKDLPQPGVFEAQHWRKHKDLYGPVSSLTVLGQVIVIINDPYVALDVLEKRSIKSSSRPKQVFAGEMVGWENSLAFQQNDSRFRSIRKNMSRIIGSNTSLSLFNQLQESEVGHFLLHVLEKPNELVSHIKRETGSLILKMAYGYVAESHGEDPLIKMAVEAMENFGKAGVPGAWSVDLMPALKYLPQWFPGTGFKQVARQWHAELVETTELPYEFVKQQMALGQHNTSFLSQLFDAGEPNAEVQHTNKWSAMSLYTAGSDTTVTSITAFFLAMTISPAAQHKAQAEIDRVIGLNRLPTFLDRPNLSYVEAVIKEVLRWAPPAPMGIPHVMSEDDIVEGHSLPKGAMLLPNIWHFLHDENFYKEPMTFNPDRFVQTDDHIPEPDPRAYVFGFGRRACPGRLLADYTLFLNVAQCLAVFDIKKVVRNGQEVHPVVRFEPGVIGHPAPFENVIKPRSLEHEQLIRSIQVSHPRQESDSALLQQYRERRNNRLSK